VDCHLHYIIWAYERIEAGTGNYIDNVVVDILATSEEEALIRASTLVRKPSYCIRSVIEHFNGWPCGRS